MKNWIRTSGPNKSLKLSAMAVPILVFSGLAVSATTISLRDEPVAPRKDYNLRVFQNLRLAFTGSVEVAFEDNANQSEDDAQSSMVVTPRLGVSLHWPINPHIEIGSGLSLGYEYYTNGDIDSDFIFGFDESVGTDFKIDWFVGRRSVLRFEEEFRSQLDVPQVAGQEYVLYRNRMALVYDYPVSEQMILTLKGQQRDTWNDSDDFEHQENTTHSVDGLLMWQMNRDTSVGPYARWQNVNYDIDDNPDRQTMGGGASLVYEPTTRLRAEGSLGFEVMDVDADDAEEENGVVLSARCGYRSSPNVTHTFSLRHDRDQDLLDEHADYSRETLLGYDARWQVRKKVYLHGGASHLTMSQQGDPADVEEATILRIKAGSSYQMTRQNRLDFNYVRTIRDSDVDNSSFESNRVSVKYVHDF